MLYNRQPIYYMGIAKVYISDHTQRAYCLRQTLHCFLLHLKINLLQFTLCQFHLRKETKNTSCYLYVICTFGK